MEIKKGQAIHITPLRPDTLASFRIWGGSPGAGCMGLVPVGKSNVKGGNKEGYP